MDVRGLGSDRFDRYPSKSEATKSAPAMHATNPTMKIDTPMNGCTGVSSQSCDVAWCAAMRRLYPTAGGDEPCASRGQQGIVAN